MVNEDPGTKYHIAKGRLSRGVYPPRLVKHRLSRNDLLITAKA